MERITLYHQDIPITYHQLKKNSFSIGKSPDNDLVLVGDRVEDHHMVLYKTAGGSWRARPSGEKGKKGTEFGPDTRIAFDSFSLGFERVDEINGDAGSNPLKIVDLDLGLVGSSSQMQLLKIDIANVAPLSAPVLVCGETGTGKELVSRGLHVSSGRSNGPLVVVNCGGLTDSLMEDTLFGHRRGAFTGAMNDQKGVFEQADGGTLFLDEIGELPLSQQAALLRVIDDKTVRRIGDDHNKAIDFRLVTATNKNLRKLVEEGLFRSDLYHRISAITLFTTPLRDRPKDIALLAVHFLDQMVEELGYRQLDNGAIQKLENHNWSGNVRELRNVLYRAAAFSKAELVTANHIEIEKRELKINRKLFRLEKIPEYQIENALIRNGGNVTATAKELGVPRSSLRDKINRLAS